MRIADDFNAIRQRLEEIRRERQGGERTEGAESFMFTGPYGPLMIQGGSVSSDLLSGASASD